MSNQSLPPMPPRIAKLPRDHRGFPVPWFVTWFKDGNVCATGQGVPDFRVADAAKIAVAHRAHRCWVCGEGLGRHLAFVIGPMCAINRVSSEPPSHHDCALFSAQACPFMTRPRMRRNEKDLPDHRDAAGFMIMRNPGVVCVWITHSYKPFRAHDGGQGTLFRIGAPTSVLWFAEGKAATHDEVMASIDSGYPQLLEIATAEGADALAELAKLRAATMALVPA